MELDRLADLVAKKVVEDTIKEVKPENLPTLSIDSLWAKVIPITEQIEDKVITKFQDLVDKSKKEISIDELWPEVTDSEFLS